MPCALRRPSHIGRSGFSQLGYLCYSVSQCALWHPSLFVPETKCPANLAPCVVRTNLNIASMLACLNCQLLCSMIMTTLIALLASKILMRNCGFSAPMRVIQLVVKVVVINALATWPRCPRFTRGTVTSHGRGPVQPRRATRCQNWLQHSHVLVHGHSDPLSLRALLLFIMASRFG